MCRKISFIVDGKTFTRSANKITREKLFGSDSIEALTVTDLEPCYIGAIADNRLILPKQSQEQGYIDSHGCWYERKEISEIDGAGNTLAVHQSTLDNPIQLDQTIDLVDFISFKTLAVYQLSIIDIKPEDIKPEDEALELRIMFSLAHHKLHCFDFTYTQSTKLDIGVLMVNKKDQLFLLVCADPEFEPLCADDIIAPDTDQDTEINFDF